jgi:hypothetical protein
LALYGLRKPTLRSFDRLRQRAEDKDLH